jgi:hypothetical protein
MPCVCLVVCKAELSELKAPVNKRKQSHDKQWGRACIRDFASILLIIKISNRLGWDQNGKKKETFKFWISHTDVENMHSFYSIKIY